MIDGILLIDKEVGITSYDVIRRLKKVLEKGQKIGHAGSLDPFAEGLLIILLGRGTKFMDTFHTLKKRYILDGCFGFATDTQDITGERIEENFERRPTLSEIKEEINRNFLGEISQTPPIFSAKRVNGMRAYDLARKGEMVNLDPKIVNIFEFNVKEYDYPNIKCDIVCSSGTYIRTLMHDLGKNLGCFGTAKGLRREGIGPFDVKDSVLSGEISSTSVEKKIVALDKVRELIL